VLSPFSEAEEERLARLWGALKARADSAASASIRTLAEEVTCLRSMVQAVFDQLLLRELKPIMTYEVLVGTRPVMHALVWWRYHFSPRPDRARQRVQRYLARLERELGIALEGTPDR